MGNAGTRTLRRIVDEPDVSCKSSTALHAGVSTPHDGVVDPVNDELSCGATAK